MNSYAKKLQATSATPHSVALGFSLGTLIAVLPTPGIGLLMGALIILIFKRINKLALIGGLILFNPLVLTPLYIASYHLGNHLLGTSPVVEFDITLANMVFHMSKRFLLGNAIIAVSLAALGYIITYAITRYAKNKRERKKRSAPPADKNKE